MATTVVGKALSYVGDKLLDYFKNDLLKSWAASKDLGSNVRALELELLSVKAVLEHILGKEIHNSALKELLDKLQDLGYEADDVLDEMDYFRIQDALDGTSHAADQHPQGWAHSLALNAHHTATATADKLICLSASASRACSNTIIHAVGKCFHCSPLPLLGDDDDDGDDDRDDEENSGSSMQHDPPERYHTNEPTNKLTFYRVDASDKMKRIVEEMKELRQRISEIITTLGSHWVTVPNSAQSHRIRISTSESIEPRLYGRDHEMNGIIDDVINGKYASEVLTVIPIVGPGGIGKTTLAQHIYHSDKLQQHFNVKVWTCVSLNFDVNKLIEEIQKYIPKVDNERIGTPGELIGQRLIKGRKLFLVLDDIWDCKNEDQWKQLLLPFRKSQERGNIILATTRFPEQAQIMTQKSGHSIYLQGLPSEDFEKLFLHIVFGDDDQSRLKDHVFLFDIGFKIAGRLKGSPLAAKTVGRLLKTQLDLNHWTRVLESKEWEKSEGENDIMPALKLSFDYLPSHQLKQCLSYCALFPQVYKFKEEDLINFWTGQQVVHSSCAENKTVEDIERDHISKLVDYGFLESKQEEDGSTCYNIHHLLHELARKVSSHECLIIDSSQSQVRSLQVLPSIRHLSINIEETSVKDRMILKNCVEDFKRLFTRLKVEKLLTLMLFGLHHGCFLKAFGGLLKEAKALRVIFISEASYNVEDLLHNFYHLSHLRYLRIGGYFAYETRFPNKLSRFYHMMILDAKHYAFIDDLPRDMSNLVKLRHFLVGDDAIHSSIIEVGKLKSLQELRRFVIKREGKGFDLREIGNLVDLCGSLSIYSLEKVQVKKEADEAKLLQKDHLRELILHWNNIDRPTDDSTLEEHVLESLKPSSNLQKLSIIGHSGGTCPSWLGMNLSLSSLRSLCLVDVAWKTFPPIGDLGLVNVPCVEISINIPEKRFGNLRRLELVNLSGLKTWAVHAPCQLFPYLEVLIIKDCHQLVELSFSHSAECCQHGKEVNVNLFPRLKNLEIRNCVQLSSFPPVPWTEALCSINIQETSSLGILICQKENNYEYGLILKQKKDTNDGTFWNVLAFHNLTRLKVLRLPSCKSLPLYYLQMLSSLRKLEMSCFSNVFPFVEGDIHVKYQFPVESLAITKWNASGKELTQLLTYLPKLSHLYLWGCEKQVTGMAVNVREQQQGARAKEDPLLLLLPPQLQDLRILDFPELRLHSDPHDDNNEDGRTGGGGGGLQGLTSLQGLEITNCPKLLSSYSSSSLYSNFPFPNSLEHLDICGVVGMDTVVPLSNLTSLTSLSIYQCGDLRGKGLFSLLTQGHLTKLSIMLTPNYFVDSEHSQSQVHEQDIPSGSSKLQEIEIDDVAGFSAMPIRHNLLFSSLTKLVIFGDIKVERFTEEQEALLFVNALEEVTFSLCDNLQALPGRLHRLPNLKSLEIWRCEEIQSLPKDCLPDSLQKLCIKECPAIQSLPEVDDLPSLLRELDVSESESEELRRQCRKLKNIIPIVKA